MSDDELNVQAHRITGFQTSRGFAGKTATGEMLDDIVGLTLRFENLAQPAPHLCQSCAVDHAPEAPHNQQSLHYQYWFRLQEARAGREERWPSWADAMAHCNEDTRAAWAEALAERGVDVG